MRTRRLRNSTNPLGGLKPYMAVDSLDAFVASKQHKSAWRIETPRSAWQRGCRCPSKQHKSAWRIETPILFITRPFYLILRNSTNPLGGLKHDRYVGSVRVTKLRNSTNPLGGLKRGHIVSTIRVFILRNSTNPLGGLKLPPKWYGCSWPTLRNSTNPLGGLKPSSPAATRRNW